MERYSEQANIYKSGINQLVEVLNEIVIDLEKIKKRLEENKDENDLFTYYVNKFNEDMKKETENLILECNSDSISLIMKAQELDRQEQLENEQNSEMVGDRDE